MASRKQSKNELSWPKSLALAIPSIKRLYVHRNLLSEENSVLKQRLASTFEEQNNEIGIIREQFAQLQHEKSKQEEENKLLKQQLASTFGKQNGESGTMRQQIAELQQQKSKQEEENNFLRKKVASKIGEHSIMREQIAAFQQQNPNAIKMPFPPGHFYSPIVDPADASRHLAALEASGTPNAIPGILLDNTQMVDVWRSLLPFLQSIPFPENELPHFRYAFNNENYSWRDGSILHAMLRLHRPKRLIEIGGGWSSACTLDTVEKYLDGNCELTFVEPFPKLLRGLIGEFAGRVRIVERPVQQVSLEIFGTLEAGDFLVIDSTHVAKTGSDVCFELFEVLTRLPRGVFVHLHDMFWPFEYSRTWAVDQNRSWNEIYVVRAFLTNNDAWRIIFFNNYFAKRRRPMIEATYPQFLRNPGGALWLQRL